jgi:hypothetical protein
VRENKTKKIKVEDEEKMKRCKKRKSRWKRMEETREEGRSPARTSQGDKQWSQAQGIG